MKCSSGNHEWDNPVSARRCCNPRWERVLVESSDSSKYDPNGQVAVEGTLMVHVWKEVGQGEADGGFTKGEGP